MLAEEPEGKGRAPGVDSVTIASIPWENSTRGRLLGPGWGRRLYPGKSPPPL